MSASAPKVGVGVVILRQLKENDQPEVLLIKRGKAPRLGMWSFCGGSLELGETIVECAIREAKEETGLTLRHLDSIPPAKFAVFSDLRHPVAFTAVDSITRDPENQGGISFHYAIPEVAALPEDYRAEPVASDDAAAVQWVGVGEELKNVPDLVPNAIEVVEEALRRFPDIPRE